MPELLNDKTAIVTGASKGIGKAIAELFAHEGASVVLTARGQTTLDETVQGITSRDGKAIGVIADSADPAAPGRVFAMAIERFGKVDILVNNAGFGEMVPVEDATDAHFEEVMAINLFGVFRYCREASRHFMPAVLGSSSTSRP